RGTRRRARQQAHRALQALHGAAVGGDVSDSRYPISDARYAVLVAAVLTLVATAAYPRLEALQMPAAPVYAIQGAKIVTAGTTIDKGNLVMRNGLIEDVGAGAAVPVDAVIVDGTGMTVYPGLIDMTNTTAVEPRPLPAVAPLPDATPDAQGGGRGRGA